MSTAASQASQPLGGEPGTPRPNQLWRVLPGERQQTIDLSPISLLLSRIKEAYQPEQVWLFGSRARGDAKPWSDWDLLVVVSDNSDERLLDPVRAFRLQKGSGVYADVIPCLASEFQESRGVVNTICYAAATEGVLIDER